MGQGFLAWASALWGRNLTKLEEDLNKVCEMKNR